MKVHRSFLILWLGCWLHAQAEPEVIVVDQRVRSGAHFSSLVEAVASARPNSKIVVRRGSYSLPSRAPIVIDKPLQIVGEMSGSEIVIGVFHPIEIGGIGRGDEVTIRGLRQVPCVGLCNDGLEIHDCAGTVVLDNVIARGGPYPNRVVRIERCEKVFVRDSVVDAGEDPILIEDATVVCERSAVISGARSAFGHPAPKTTVRLGVGADLTLIESDLIGASTASLQSAVAMDGGIVRVGPRSALVSEPLLPLGIAPQGGTASGTIWMDPRAFWQSAPNPNGPGGFYVPAGIDVVATPVRLVKATAASPGESYTATLHGAHTGVDLFAAIVSSPMTTSPFPNLHGSTGSGPDPDYSLAWMDPAVTTVLYFGAPTGQVTQSVGAAVPLWTGDLLQGVFLGADNVVRLTPPFAQWVVDPDR